MLSTPTFEPTRSTCPTACVPIPVKSELKSIFNILISWSLVNFSVGVNIRFFSPVEVISVENSPNSKVVKSVVFSSKNALSVVVNVITSVNCTSDVSGSTIWIK